MRDERKAKSQLINELRDARHRIEVLEQVVDQSDPSKNAGIRQGGEAAVFYEQLPLSYQSLDEKARILYVNTAWTRMMGYSRAQAIGRSYFEFVAPEEQESLEDDFDAFMEYGEVHDVERTLIRADGSRLVVAIDGKVVREDAGGGLRTHCILKDMTFQRLAEAKLRDSARAYRVATEHLPVVVYSRIADRTPPNLFVTGSVEELTGYTREELVEDPGLFEQIVHPEDRQRVNREIQEHRKTHKALDVEFRIVTKQGELKWIRDRAVRGVDETGKVERIDGVAADITTRKLTEQALERSRGELEAIYEHASVMMCTLDAERRVLYANDEFTKFTKVSEAELQDGRACGVFGCINATEDPRGCGFGPSCRDCQLRQAIEDTENTGRSHRDVEYRATLVQGSVRREVVMLGCTARIPAPDQAVVLLCLHDVSERVRAEAALRLSERRLQRAQEVARIGAWEWYPATGETYWSDQVYRLFGLEPGETDPSYELARRFVHPEDLKLWETTVADAMKSGHSFRCEYRAIRKDGRKIWVHNEAEIIPDQTGKAVTFFGTVQDVTDLRRTMETLRERNREFELVFDTVPAMIFLKDLRRRHLKVNRALIEATGVAETEWIGRTIDEILPKLARGYDRVDREVLRSGKAKLGSLERYESTRGIRWSRTNKIPVLDDAGSVCGLVGFGIDVTEEVLAQNGLKERLFDLDSINRFVIRSTRFRTVDSLCKLAADTVRQLNRRAFVTVSFFDPAVGGPRLRAVAGLGRWRAEISGLLKAEPETIWGRAEDMGEQARAHAAVFTSGRLEEVPGGFATLCDGTIPTETSERITAFLGIERVYTVALTMDRRIMGGLSILLEQGQELQHGMAIETIARHLSVVVHRLLGEGELRNSRSRYRQLALRTSDLLENQSASISRELHDDLGQSLTALAMDLAVLDNDLRSRPESIEQLAGTIGDMRGLLNDSLDKVKNLSHMLRPIMLDSAGTIEVLQWQLEEFGRRSGFETRLRSRVEAVELPKDQSAAVFRCVQEALTNCARHSRAQYVELTIRKRKTDLFIEIRDDGVGFDTDGLGLTASLGLLGIQEHADACGGRAEIKSTPGKGTTVTIRVPLEGKR